MTVNGVAVALLGLLYVLHAFGPTEAEVVTWGMVSICLGLVLALLSAMAVPGNKASVRWLLLSGYTAAAVLQVIPILLWFLFHGSGISDGTPPSVFVAHWGYAIPHLVLLITSLMVVGSLFRRMR